MAIHNTVSREVTSGSMSLENARSALHTVLNGRRVAKAPIITNELNRVRDGQRDIDQQSMTRQGQSADKLFGAPVFDPTGKKIGTVLQIQGAGRSLLVIVEVGGFLGIGARPIALGESEIAFSKAEDGSVRWETTLTNESLKDRATVHEI